MPGTNTTTAQKISARYGDDGLQWDDVDGVDLSQATEDAGGSATYRDGYRTGEVVRWVFEDGSAIITAGACWDLQAAGCTEFCLSGEGCTCDTGER